MYSQQKHTQPDHITHLLPHGLTRCICALMAGIMTTSCHLMSNDERQIAQQAEKFAEYYFNYDLDKAAGCCTTDSRPWIQLLASNLTAEDIRRIRASQQTETIMGDVEMLSDTSAVVSCQVSEFIDITADTTKQQRTYLIPMVCRNGQWHVRMAGPLRSERKNPSQD